MKRVSIGRWIAVIGIAFLMTGLHSTAVAQEERGERPRRQAGERPPRPDRAERPERPQRGENRQRPAGQDEDRARGPRGPQDAVLGLVRQLELTDEQQTKIRQIIQEHQAGSAEWREANRDKIESTQRAVREAIEAGDREKAMRIRREFAESSGQPNSEELEKKVREVLTAEQRTKLDELQKEREDRLEQMRERREGRGAGAEGAQGRRGPRAEGAEGRRGPRAEGAEGRRGPRAEGEQGRRGRPEGAGEGRRRGGDRQDQ